MRQETPFAAGTPGDISEGDVVSARTKGVGGRVEIMVGEVAPITAQLSAARGVIQRLNLGEFVRADEDSEYSGTQAVSGGTRNRPSGDPKRNSGPTPPSAPVQKPAPRRLPTPILDKFGDDITARAKNNEVDPAFGVDEAVAKITQILGRRTKANPVLVGGPGVGKTAIVDEFARQAAIGWIPEYENHRVISLSSGLLTANTKYRGEYEERVKGIIEEAVKSQTTQFPIVLFIDEVHTLVSSKGEGEGGGPDMSNMLKPALARGELKVIGATTDEEWRIVEKDPALARRFNKVTVEEPRGVKNLLILLESSRKLSDHHGVRFTDQAIIAADRLSTRYDKDHNQPDSGLDLLDEAGSAIKMQSRKKDRIAGEKPELIVDEAAIAQVASKKYNMPVGSLLLDEKEAALTLYSRMNEKVVGQEELLRTFERVGKREAAGVADPKRPFVMIIVGPTGTGKTYTTNKFAEETGRPVVRLDMSEYMERHSISRLVGAPPGYVGFREPGQLTEAVRRSPNAVLLLDEIEKAHPDVFRMFLQVFEDGRLTDGSGRVVDFSNTTICMTSNFNVSGSSGPSLGFAFPDDRKTPEKTETDNRKELLRLFPPELINRLDAVVPADKLVGESMVLVARLELKELEQLAAKRGTTLDIDPAVGELIAEACQRQFGNARAARREVEQRIANPLAELILEKGEAATARVRIERKGNGIVLIPTPLSSETSVAAG